MPSAVKARACLDTVPVVRADGAPLASIVQVVRTTPGLTRAVIAERCGIARSTLGARLDVLKQAGLVEERRAASTGGRPPAVLSFNPSAGVVLALEVARRRVGAVAGDLSGAPLAEFAVQVHGGTPTDLHRAVAEAIEWGTARRRVRGIGVAFHEGVDPTVADATRRTIRDTDMLVAEASAAGYAALAEQRRFHPNRNDVVYVAVNDQLATGMVIGGSLLRGANGAAGQLAHTVVHGAPRRHCRCGNRGCLDVVASGGAIAARLTGEGFPTRDSQGVLARLAARERAASGVARQAGRMLGAALAAVVHLVQPDVILIGGTLGTGRTQILAGVRETVHERAAAALTEQLRIAPARLGPAAVLKGALLDISDQVLAPAPLEQLVLEAL